MSVFYRHHQRGGTFLGFTLGVLCGLAGALAVAVYVTKVPVPFVDRVISRTASEDIAEAERNKNWNPNAAIAGKQANKPADAQPAPAKEVPTPPPDADAEAAKAKKQAAEDIKAAAAKAEAAAKESTVDAQGKVYSSDPLGDLAKNKAAGKVVSTAPSTSKEASPPTVEPFTYFVQVGAFRTPEDAQAQRAKLVLMGLDAQISEREQSGRTVYRVRLGPYARLTDAEKMKEELAPSGLETALVRVQR